MSKIAAILPAFNEEVSIGSVVLVAKHLPQRELKVTAGELEVRDVGTRSLPLVVLASAATAEVTRRAAVTAR